MQTVSSSPSTSLIYWNQNANKSNLSEANFNGNALVLKPFYFKVFSSIASALKDNHVTKFISLWQDTMSEAESELRPFISNAFLNHTADDAKMAERVVNKFRGNCGEIFAEKLFTSGLGADVCKVGSYVPVDPHHEEGVDATGVSNVSGLKIGIQVKNFSSGEVDIDVFRTAGDESDKLSHSLESVEQFKDFLRCPSQVILSFTDARKIIVQQYEKRVRFLGPSYIESRGLCGKQGNACGNWTFFQDIADEISILS